MAASLSPQFPDYPFLRGGGQMGELIRALDWERSPLGSPANWPQLLKHTVSMMLKNSFPVLICWGPDYIQLYNDAFRPINGETKHPQALGGSARDTYAEIWPTIGPMFGDVMAGQTHGFPNFKVPLDRNGYLEDCYFDFSYSPVADADGEIQGVLVVCVETTAKVNAAAEAEKNRLAVSAERDRLNRFFMQAPTGICILDGPELVFELVNPNYQALFPGRELLGKALLEAIPEVRDQPIWGVLQQVYRSGETYEGNELLIPLARTDGGPVEDRYFNFIYQARLDEQQRPDGIMVFVIEVTGMINVQHDLDRQKRIYETITSNTPDLMYVWDLDYRFTYANSALLAMWGKTRENAIGKTLLENGYEPWHAEMHEREIDQVKATKQPVRGEVSFPHAVLGRRVYDYILTPVLNAQGEVEAVAGTTRDITDRKLWEEKLAQASEELQVTNEEMAATNEEMAASNEELTTTNEELITIQQRLEDSNRELVASGDRLRMAIESTNLGTWDYDPRSGELYWSPECRDIYGIPAGQPETFAVFSEHLHGEDRSWVEAAIQQAIDPIKGGHYDLTFRIIRFDNRESRWVKVNGSVYFDNGVASRFIGTVLDITDIKDAEEKSAKLAAIIQSSDDAIISKTLDSIITSWNAGAQRIFGYEESEMIGESIYKLIPQDRLEEEPMILGRLSAGERVEHFETKRQTKDGRLIDVSLTISPVKDPQGNIIGLSKIARDITEKKLDETRKNDFIGMVSHELKTPLTSLSALLQVANLKLKKSPDQFLTDAMEKSNVQVRRMTAMINGFLNISRLESGKIQIEQQPFDMETLISDMISEAKLTVSTHLISFIPCGPVEVNADRDKIGSVLSNLISNAVKYSPKGKNIEVACQANDDSVIVSVKDEGMGIKPDDLAKIFDRYYRVETTHTRHISGFGIGLYLSAEIIRGHGGRVWAESESGVGSVFYFSLPR
jgi:PAS domain S-box-containing protein